MLLLVLEFEFEPVSVMVIATEVLVPVPVSESGQLAASACSQALECLRLCSYELVSVR